MAEPSSDQIDLAQDNQISRRRLANIISVLLPAREYCLECSWTTEHPLPAVEEFACRLILVMDGVRPAELKGYFGLSDLEVDGLVRNLVRNRLVDVIDDGTLQPSAMLQAKCVVAQDIPTFTGFETREENAVFDLLALQLVARRSYSNARFGLPEVPIPDSAKSVSSDRIAEAFSEQSRAFLEFSRGKTKDVHKTRLYKVSRCRPKRTLQVPVDMEVSLEAEASGELAIHRDAVERLGENRRRPLSIELESQVADYLAQGEKPSNIPTVEEFCALVGDEILARYAHKHNFDLGKWAADRDSKKTGYGNQDTRALLGPIYLSANRITLINMLGRSVQAEDPSQTALWLPSVVPFWAANSSELTEFVSKFQRALGHEGEGRLVACFCSSDHVGDKWIKKKFNSRLPHAVIFSGDVTLDRVELLVVPERLVVAQYHLQPSKTSAITLPIGFVSIDLKRISKVTKILTDRLMPSVDSSVLWSADSESVHSLIDFQRLGLGTPGQSRRDMDTQRRNGKAAILGGKIVWERPSSS